MILELCKGVHCVDLGKSFPTRIYLQKSASMQPRTSPSKFGRKFNSSFICLLSRDQQSARGQLDGPGHVHRDVHRVASYHVRDVYRLHRARDRTWGICNNNDNDNDPDWELYAESGQTVQGSLTVRCEYRINHQKRGSIEAKFCK